MAAEQAAPAGAVTTEPEAPRAYQEGDIVRLKASGREFTIDDVNPNPNYVADEESFVEGFGDSGSAYAMTPDEIELVMTGEQAQARQAPTAAEIGSQVSSSLHSPIGEIAVDVTETDIDGPGVILASGKAPNGLLVSFKVTISEVHWEAHP